MGATGWLVFVAGAALALLGAWYVYARREMPGRGRPVLLGLRGLAGALILLLVLDPELPAVGSPPAEGPRVLLDASLSMRAPIPAGGTRWTEAVREAERLAAGRPVLLFGSAVRSVAADALRGIEPVDPASRLLPALRAAAEAGARRVVILTDGGLDDAADVARWLPRLGVELDYRLIGEPVPNRALAEVRAPDWAEAGQPIEIEVGVAATGGLRGRVAVAIRSETGEVVGRTEVEAPEAGRVATSRVSVTPPAPPGGGPVRLTVALEGTDPLPEDDARTLWVHVTDAPPGLVFVSLRPDWETRFLQPVLQQATGLPPRGFLMVSPGEWVRTGAGLEAGVRATDEAVRRGLAQAAVLVVHGLDDATPLWIRQAVSRAPRVIVLGAAAGSDVGLPFVPARPVVDEWYPMAEVPPSPVAALLAGLSPDEAPPLTSLAPGSLPPGAWAPLLVSRGRRGATAPALIVGESGGRRWAVATGEGYWRWAFRGGEARQLYARLWSAVVGWMIQERTADGRAPVRPATTVVARGTPIAWLTPGLAADSLRVRLEADDGTVAVDTLLLAAGRDSVAMAAAEPGHYRWEVAVFAGDTVRARAGGPLTVETYTSEHLRPPVSLAQLRAAGSPLAEAPGRRGRPLRTLPWPYAVIVAALCTEWVLRRRWGLR
jgi:hypothetical protein